MSSFYESLCEERRRCQKKLDALDLLIREYECEPPTRFAVSGPDETKIEVRVPAPVEAPPPVEKVDLRKGPRTAAKPAAPNAWTEAEYATLRAVILQGGNVADAKKALPERGQGTVQSHFYAMKREMRDKGEIPEAFPAKVAPVERKVDTPAPTIKTLPPASPSKPVEYKIPAESGHYSDKAVLMRLRNLGHVDPWSPDLDAELVELLLTGTKAGQAAEILEIPKDQCVARFKRLCPDDGIDSQRQVLRLLKELAKVPA